MEPLAKQIACNPFLIALIAFYASEYLLPISNMRNKIERIASKMDYARKREQTGT